MAYATVLIFIVAWMICVEGQSIDMENNTSSVSAGQSCNFIFMSENGKTGEFKTPNFPLPYPANITCRFQFRAEPGYVIMLKWFAFHLEEPMPQTHQCLRDYMLVIVTDYRKVQHVSSRYCGNKLPPDLPTLQRSIDVLFQSSIDSIQFSGFRGQYQFVAEEKIPAPRSVWPGQPDPVKNGCGGNIDPMGHGGVIFSPYYPAAYPAMIRCNWLIRVAPDKKIFIKLVELNLTPTFASCNHASLSLIDGYAHYLPGNENKLPLHQRILFCGGKRYYTSEGDKSYITERNRLIIRFETRDTPPQKTIADNKENGQPIGFYLVWTEVSTMDDVPGLSLAEQKEQCNGFLCAGGDICIDEGSTMCGSRTKYCIHPTLVCDGVPHCGEHDNSDEENCDLERCYEGCTEGFMAAVMTYKKEGECKGYWAYIKCMEDCPQGKKVLDQSRKEKPRAYRIMERKCREYQ